MADKPLMASHLLMTRVKFLNVALISPAPLLTLCAADTLAFVCFFQEVFPLGSLPRLVLRSDQSSQPCSSCRP